MSLQNRHNIETFNKLSSHVTCGSTKWQFNFHKLSYCSFLKEGQNKNIQPNWSLAWTKVICPITSKTHFVNHFQVLRYMTLNMGFAYKQTERFNNTISDRADSRVASGDRGFPLAMIWTCLAYNLMIVKIQDINHRSFLFFFRYISHCIHDRWSLTDCNGYSGFFDRR